MSAGFPAETPDPMNHSSYGKLFLMLAISFTLMYAVMFLNVFALDHVRLSLTRAYMALLMVAPMAVLMILMMGHMYADRRRNRLIVGGAVAVFLLALIGLRAQRAVGDAQYMRAMISHHSSAILTSERAHLQDERVQHVEHVRAPFWQVLLDAGAEGEMRPLRVEQRSQQSVARRMRREGGR